jgi:hypothetical protein
MGDPKKTYAFRFDPELMARVDAYAKKADWLSAQEGLRGGKKPCDIGRTALVESLLLALVEDRVVVHPRASVGAFPLEEVEPGVSPELPVLVCLSWRS